MRVKNSPSLYLFLVLGLLFPSLACKLVQRAMSMPLNKSTPAVASPSREPYPNTPQAAYLGQDGADYAGEQCSAGSSTSDNIHIHLSGLRKNQLPVTYRIDDGKGGVWANPCDPTSTWILMADSKKAGEIDLYFKPRQSAPTGPRYLILMRYPDEVIVPLVVESTEAVP